MSEEMTPPLTFWSPTVGIIWQLDGTYVTVDPTDSTLVEYGFEQPEDAIEMVASDEVDTLQAIRVEVEQRRMVGLATPYWLTQLLGVERVRPIPEIEPDSPSESDIADLRFDASRAAEKDER